MTNHRGRVIGVAKVYHHTVDLRSSLLVRAAGHAFEQPVYVVLVRALFACKPGRPTARLASDGALGTPAPAFSRACRAGEYPLALPARPLTLRFGPGTREPLRA